MSKVCGVLNAAERPEIAVCTEFLVTGSNGVSCKAHKWCVFKRQIFTPSWFAE
jgi:hypothetical protein